MTATRTKTMSTGGSSSGARRVWAPFGEMPGANAHGVDVTPSVLSGIVLSR
jgi:hypothetical protein